jgi:low molecular weight protein-tyrosine phosphatase
MVRAFRRDRATIAERMVAICFVCHGNICRSPTAEGVMRRLVSDANLGGRIVIASAGVSAEHAGDAADPRSRAAARRRGYTLEGRAQRFEATDFARYDLVIALDRDNLRRLRALARDDTARAKLRLLREFDSDGPGLHDVPDPWYGEGDGFELVLDLCERTCAGLLARLRSEHGLG